MRSLLTILTAYATLCLSTSNVWAIAQCPIYEPPNTWTNCTGEMQPNLHSTYVGAFKNGKFHGAGVLTNADGRVEKGLWQEGKLSSTPETDTSQSSLKDNKLYPLRSGTGFAVSHSGHIVTNHHVIKGCDLVKAIYQGHYIKLATVFSDGNNDLALLKGDFKPTSIFKLSRKDPSLMENIFVAGYPTALNTTIKVTKGVVSSLAGADDNLSEFQFDAAINSGSSGGPIFNDSGNVLGVVVSGYDTELTLEHLASLAKGETVTIETIQNQNYGIKASVVISLLESNGVNLTKPNRDEISSNDLRNVINAATYELLCWASGKRLKNMSKSD